MDIAGKEKNSLESKLSMFSEFGEGWVSLTLPIRTVSEANSSEHWHKKAKRHAIQQRSVLWLLKPLREKIRLPCHIKLTRYAPRQLDKHDNLPISMKWITDACCAIITGDYRAGRADDDERISISYDQVKNSKYGVKILITY